MVWYGMGWFGMVCERLELKRIELNVFLLCCLQFAEPNKKKDTKENPSRRNETKTKQKNITKKHNKKTVKVVAITENAFLTI